LKAWTRPGAMLTVILPHHLLIELVRNLELVAREEEVRQEWPRATLTRGAWMNSEGGTASVGSEL
jgi:hypothetical protein